MASSSGSPCAACKFLRRKCTAECVFAPYFPPDQPSKFSNVHKIFGASNITKILNELPQHQREDAVQSLAYEAECRMKDPVYGCVKYIGDLQRTVQYLSHQLMAAKADLARCAEMAANGQGPLLQPPTPPQLNPSLMVDMASMALQQQQQDPVGGFGSSQSILDQQHQFANLTREQYAEIVRVGGGSFEAGLHALAINPNLVMGGGGGVGGGPSSPSPMSTSGLYGSYQRPSSDGASRSSGGSMGHPSPH